MEQISKERHYSDIFSQNVSLLYELKYVHHHRPYISIKLLLCYDMFRNNLYTQPLPSKAWLQLAYNPKVYKCDCPVLVILKLNKQPKGWLTVNHVLHFVNTWDLEIFLPHKFKIIFKIDDMMAGSKNAIILAQPNFVCWFA